MQTVTLRGVTLGAGRPKVIVPLMGATPQELRAEVTAVPAHGVDVLEWRVDHLGAATETAAVLAAAAAVREAARQSPVLATFRTAAEGGRSDAAPDVVVDLLGAIVASGAADAVDVEAELGALADGVVAAAHGAGVAVVMSRHDLEGTPPRDEIRARLREMHGRGADVAKIAVTPRDAGDVLDLLAATHEYTSGEADRPVVTMSMTALGVVSRLAGETFGSCATFGTVGRASAPGQVPVADLAPVLDLVHGRA